MVAGGGRAADGKEGGGETNICVCVCVFNEIK
jgi:hypothetical protein